MRASLEVADIFRTAGPSYRATQAGHLSLDQLKVMSAIQNCRTAALGGHVEGCEECGLVRVAYNSCRNRHCPKCQSAAARAWLAAREADLLPVGYFHVVFTLPAQVSDIAWQNKTLLYDLLLRAAAQTVMTIAAPFCVISRRSGRSDGWSTPSLPLPAPKRCSPISRATPIASQSRTGGCSRSTRQA